jgi:hypothetical protein
VRLQAGWQVCWRCPFPRDADRLDIGVAGEQQMRGHAFQKRGAVLARVRPRQQIEQRMLVKLGGALVQHERQPADALGGEPHRAMHDGVAAIAFARQRRIVARRPARPPAVLDGDQAGGQRRFALRRASSDLRRLSMVVLSSRARTRESGATR